MKKIISLLLVCFMVMSMAVIASAAPTGSTMSVSKLTTADVVNHPTLGAMYRVIVSLDKVYTDADSEARIAEGYNAWQFDLLYDNTKVTYVNGSVPASGWSYSSYDFFEGWKKTALTGSISQITDSATGKSGVRVVGSSNSATSTMLNRASGDKSLVTYYFKPVENATGKAVFTLKNIEFATANTTYAHKDADFTLVDGEIDLGGEVVTPKYTVTATAGANGSIAEKDGKTEGATGDVLTYNITADTGYVIDTITVDGVADTSKAGQDSATITYTVAEAAGAISVTFKAEETETTIKTMPNRYKDGDAIYTLGKVVEGTNGCSRYGVAVYSEKRGQEVYYSGSGKTAEGFYVVGFRGTAFNSEAATRAFADTDDGRIFGDSVTAIYGE